DVFFGAGDQRRLQRSNRPEQLSTGSPDIEPQVEGDLVIATPAGMELATQRAELLLQSLLDSHMDVCWHGAPPPGPPPQRGRGIFHRRRGKCRRGLLQAQVAV